MHWNDIKAIANSLEENYPDEDVFELTTLDLEDLIKSLPDFDDHEIPTTKERLKEIRDAWTEIKDGETDEESEEEEEEEDEDDE